MKRTAFSLLFALVAMNIMAQSGTNSPYSQYGLGKLADQSQSASRGMNGVGIAIREHNQVNTINPASYSSIDSLTFIFDIGMSLQKTNFKEGGRSLNANNANFEYVVGAFRAWKHVGMAFGFLPYSNVGYNYSQVTDLDGYTIPSTTSSVVTQTNTFSGSGGLRKAFIGIGIEPLRNLSIGANANYLWGNINNIITSSYSDPYIKSFVKSYETSTKSFMFNIGGSYTLNIGKGDKVTAAATVTPRVQLSDDPFCDIITANAQDGVVDTTKYVAHNAGEIPIEFGAGLSYKGHRGLLIGADYTYLRGSEVGVKDFIDKNGARVESTDKFLDRHKVNLGAQYCRNEYSRSYADRVMYRFGASYATPYVKINGKDGPTEIAVSAGIGLPITNMYNNRSILNLSVKWMQTNAKSFVRENCFMINIGMTFNERWFAKWKFE